MKIIPTSINDDIIKVSVYNDSDTAAFLNFLLNKKEYNTSNKIELELYDRLINYERGIIKKFKLQITINSDDNGNLNNTYIYIESSARIGLYFIFNCDNAPIIPSGASQNNYIIIPYKKNDDASIIAALFKESINKTSLVSATLNYNILIIEDNLAGYAGYHNKTDFNILQIVDNNVANNKVINKDIIFGFDNSERNKEKVILSGTNYNILYKINKDWVAKKNNVLYKIKFYPSITELQAIINIKNNNLIDSLNTIVEYDNLGKYIIYNYYNEEAMVSINSNLSISVILNLAITMYDIFIFCNTNNIITGGFKNIIQDANTFKINDFSNFSVLPNLYESVTRYKLHSYPIDWLKEDLLFFNTYFMVKLLDNRITQNDALIYSDIIQLLFDTTKTAAQYKAEMQIIKVNYNL